MINKASGEGLQLRRVLTAAALAVVLASCSEEESEEVSTEQSAETTTFVDSVFVEPYFERLTEDGKTC